MSETTETYIVPALTCGCVPLAGGGVARLCSEGSRLWAAYLRAIEVPTPDERDWYGPWRAYTDHCDGTEAAAARLSGLDRVDG